MYIVKPLINVYPFPVRPSVHYVNQHIIHTSYMMLLLAIIVLILVVRYYILCTFACTLIFFSLHSYDSLCQRGSELMLVIRLNQLYWITSTDI